MLFPLRDSIRSLTTPVMTLTLIALNVAIFVYQILLPTEEANFLVSHYGVIPARLQWMDLFTSMFLHGGIFHLLGNVWFLWIYGDNVEDILGPWQFLLFYLACGVVAGLAQVMATPDLRVPTIGASGAIAGVMGAYLVKFRHSKILTLVFVLLVFTIEIPAAWLLVYWFVLQFFSGIGSTFDSNTARGGVAWFAHIGGFLAGLALIYLFRTRPAYWRRADLHW
jgi:membrane associated rhomboid family serine protease